MLPAADFRTGQGNPNLMSIFFRQRQDLGDPCDRKRGETSPCLLLWAKRVPSFLLLAERGNHGDRAVGLPLAVIHNR